MGNGILYLEFKLKIEFPHLSLLCIQFLFFFSVIVKCDILCPKENME